MFKHLRNLKSSWAMPLILCALLVRLVIPAGWMPTVDDAGYARITLCTGTGAQDAWIDASGKLHKSDPAQQHKSDNPCVFATLGAAFALPILVTTDLNLVFLPHESQRLHHTSSVGRGLVAPPPPATGPPALI